jgi:predicted small lipoprotein YifL
LRAVWDGSLAWISFLSGDVIRVGTVERVKLGIILATVALGLAGCGVRGSLELPPEAKQDSTAKADSGQGKPEGATPKPHKDFILDGLLR